MYIRLHIKSVLKMKKFLIGYVAPKSANNQIMEATEEQKAAGIQAWMDWAKSCGDKLVDLGAPLGKAEGINRSGNKDSNSSLAGYSVLRAESLEDAKAMLKNHPHIMWNPDWHIDIQEMMSIPTS